MVRGCENTFDPDIFVDSVRERFKFTLMHVPAVKFRQTMFHAGHLSNTGRYGDDDFVILFFYCITDYHRPGAEFHSPGKTFEPLFFDMEPFYYVF